MRPPTEAPPARRARITDVLSRDEIAQLTRASDVAGAWAIATSWAVIAATLAALARFPHPFVFALAVVVLGGRQLALTVCMHEAAHRSLFRQRWLNDVLTDWLCARPVWLHLARYRTQHVAHHAHTGTERDPDRALVAPFPCSVRTLARKLARDLALVSGVRRAIGLAMMDAGVLAYNVSGDIVRRPDAPASAWGKLRAFGSNAGGTVLANLTIFGALALAGAAWTYLAWVVAWLTTYGLFLRLRAIAEHACTEASSDPFRNTRTTTAGLLARMTVAPLNVSYHLEHHLLVTTPWFRLPTLHATLRARGALEHSPVARSYAAVLRTVTSPSVS